MHKKKGKSNKTTKRTDQIPSGSAELMGFKVPLEQYQQKFVSIANVERKCSGQVLILAE
jgi:hypothetical protein